MGGVARAVFRAPAKLFKSVFKGVSKIGKKKKKPVQLVAQATTDAKKQVAKRALLLGGGATSTLMTGPSGIEDKAKAARTTLGA